MNKDLTLVIMAAGMGSRFGGLKQIEPFGPNDEFIIDYSVYDAKRAGFTKIVFIIKEENYKIFKDTIGKRVEDKIPTYYAFQKMTDIPSGVTLPEERVKPLGTGQAILSVKDLVNGPFAVINSDDFYGFDAYLKAKEFFEENKDENVYANIAYQVKNTLTENGSVKRGVCKEENGFLKTLIESKVEKINGQIVAEPLDGREKFIIDGNDPVSMNMFCFYKSIFKYLEEGFIDFFKENKDDLLNCEYLLPDIIEKEMKKGNIKVKVIKTKANWYGVTYKEDKEKVVKEIKSLVDNNIYPNNLWNK